MARGYPDFLENSGKTSDGKTLVNWDYIVNNGTRILKNAAASVTNTTTVYTVPTGKILFITNLSLTAENTSTTVDDTVNIAVDSAIIFEMYITKDETDTAPVPLSVPLILTAGETIKINAGADAKCIGSFIGFLIDE